MANTIDPNELMFTSFEPKVKNRFILYMDGIPSYMVNTMSSPSFTDDEIKLDHINTYRKLRGKREWGDISMSLYDPLVPSGTQAVMEWARLGYESVTGRAGYSDVYKKDLTFNILDPGGVIMGEWVIKGAFIKDANFGDYDWSDSQFVNLDLTVGMDYCVLNF